MNWDLELLHLLNQTLACRTLDVVMAALTVGVIPLAILALLWVALRTRREGIGLLIVTVLPTLASVGLQFLFDRPRPIGVRLVLPMPAFPSFPSGHAAALFGCATLGALLWPRSAAPALLGAGAVSLSRIYFGHHYPSDVLGGALLGTGAATAAYSLSGQARSGSRPRWAWLLWTQATAVGFITLCAYLDLFSFAFLAVPGLDKALHFLLSGALAFLSVGWWARQPAGLVLAVLGLLALGEEALQSLSATRTFDLLDLAATMSGVGILGWLGGKARTIGVGGRVWGLDV